MDWHPSIYLLSPSGASTNQQAHQIKKHHLGPHSMMNAKVPTHCAAICSH